MAAFALAAMCGVTPLLSGCIAAVVPLAAGAAIAKTRSANGPGKSDPPRIASASARSDLRVGTPLPPDAAPQPADPAVAAFRAYSLGYAGTPPGTGKRLSAIIPTASDLRPVRTDCGSAPAAVFVDLDPGRNAFDPLEPGAPNAAVAAALAELRARGMRVVWFSRLSENFAAPVRAALAQGGLDPAAADRLVLMRSLGDRKQSRRDEVARDLCPVAMLGDERADFDELYLYLKQPEAAFPLDAMIGRGWFLVSPFHPAGRVPANGATP